MNPVGRALLIVMDSFGIGGAPDASRFGPPGRSDEGSDTLGHIASVRARSSSGPLRLPELMSLGLGHAAAGATGRWPEGLAPPADLAGSHGWAREISHGKDTPSGHWEIAGVPVLWEWSYFPDIPQCFPVPLLEAIAEESGVAGSLGNVHASGTDILARLGEEHLRTGKPIYYTSADSVFQIACHEETFGLDRLLSLCKTVRRILDRGPWRIGRVIARPFVGSTAHDFQRTVNRHDFSVPPPDSTVLDQCKNAGYRVIGLGKIGDIFAHRGLTEEIRASGHPALWQATLDALDRLGGGPGLVVVNFVDFDMLYGHRRDVPGYAAALESFDAALPALWDRLTSRDLVIITADHGNDPTWPGTDHTREQVPVLVKGGGVAPGTCLGGRPTFADIGATLARHFGLEPTVSGQPLW